MRSLETSSTSVPTSEYMDYQKPPFNNILAREALQYATNAPALNRSLYEGYGPASETLTGPDQIAYLREHAAGLSQLQPTGAKGQEALRR